MAKKVLLFAEHFAPESTPDAVRPTKLAKFLTQCGYSVTVVTRKQVARADELLRQDLRCCGKVYRAAPRKERGTVTLARGTDPGGKAAENLFARLALWCRRSLSALRAFRRDEVYAKAFLARLRSARDASEPFDFVISSDLPLSNHQAALEYKKAHPNVFWIADFCRPQDPAEPGLWKRRYRRLTKRVLKDCGVCTVADQSLRKALETLSRRRVLVRVIPQGYDPEDAEREVVRRFSAQMQDPGLFRFVFFCSPEFDKAAFEPVFRAVAELISESRIDREKIRFDCYGSRDDVRRCTASAQDHGLWDRLADLGEASRARILAAQKSAQITLACAKEAKDFHTPLPLHLYEQIGMQKPVLGIALGEGLDSELYLLIRDCRIGFCYEQSEGMASFGALKKYLAESYLYYFTRAKELYEPNEKTCERYACQNLITVWRELLEDTSF